MSVHINYLSAEEYRMNKINESRQKTRLSVKIKCFSLALMMIVVTISAGYTSGTGDRDAEACVLPVDGERITMLCPGGMPFGIKMTTKGVVVAGLNNVITREGAKNPAKDAGIMQGDIICRVSGVETESVAELCALIDRCRGDEVVLEILRNDETIALSVRPEYSVKDNCMRLGILAKDGIAGIGTVTFVDPETGEFGGLGHGICNPSGGGIMPMKDGETVPVVINRIIKGKSGKPGELRGCLGNLSEGRLTGNYNTGIYGKFESVSGKNLSKPIAVALEKQVKRGEATILCTLDDNRVSEYTIEITDITIDSKNTRNYTIRITDPRLLEKTGGIVQGMSGSPIIQDGRLVGAVTHVLVDNPSEGYGIYIGNMLR